MKNTTLEVKNVIENSDKAIFEKNNDVHYLQSLSWCKFRDDCFWASTYREDRCVASSIIRMKTLPIGLGGICYIERGPIGESLNDIISHIEEVINYLSNSNALLVMISPMMYDIEEIATISNALKSSGWVEQKDTLNLYKNTLVIDLRNSIEEIKSKFRRSLKTQINKSNKLGIDVDFESDASSICEFISFYNVVAKDRGIMPIDDETSKFIYEAISNGEAQIIIARLNGIFLGGIVLIKQGKRIIYEWGMTTQDPEYKSLPLAHKIHWEAINWAKNNGFEIYDFGGYWLQRGNDDPINYFKLGFTKVTETVTPEYNYVLKPLRTKLYKILTKLRKYFK